MRSLLLGSLLLAACGAAKTPARCPATSSQPGDVDVLGGGFLNGLAGTEGIAFSPDGRLFVAGGDSVFEVKPDGSHTTFATVPSAVGLAWWGDALFVASGDDGTHAPGILCDATRKGGVWKVTADGQASVFATGIRAPNFPAVTPWNTLLVADDCATNFNLYEVSTAGVVTVWDARVPSANGLAFDAAGATLFAATTFVTNPPVFTIPVGADHESGPETALHTYATGEDPDGLTVDADGALYVALNPKGEVHRIAKDGTEEVFASGALYDASLAFGAGSGFDECTIYATSLFGDDVYKVYVGVPGLALRR